MPDYTIQPMIFYTNGVRSPDEFIPLECFDIAPGRYMINRNGDIYSKISNRIMKQETNWASYRRIQLKTVNGDLRHYSIHRLSAQSFIINIRPEEFTDVNHLDGDKSRNHYLNLEWCTNNQNKHHASETSLYEHGEDRYNSVYSDELAHEICRLFADGVPYLDVYHKYVSDKATGSTLGSFIYKLYHRKTRKHITKLYEY